MFLLQLSRNRFSFLGYKRLTQQGLSDRLLYLHQLKGTVLVVVATIALSVAQFSTFALDALSPLNIHKHTNWRQLLPLFGSLSFLVLEESLKHESKFLPSRLVDLGSIQVNCSHPVAAPPYATIFGPTMAKGCFGVVLNEGNKLGEKSSCV